MAAPPTGTITFLFTDIEGSTRRWDEHPEAMREALARHNAILRNAIEQHGGHLFKTVGDGCHAAFPTALSALSAAVAGQRALVADTWGGAVRMALHVGVAEAQDGDYFGPPLNRVARLRDGAHGGQILLSAATAELLRERLPDGVALRDLGVYRLRGLSEPERVYQAAVWGLPADFPPLALAEDRPSSLPVPLTSLVGREAEIEQIVGLLASTRLLTLTGPGGTGKTRLAVAVAERLHPDLADGAVFVDLSPISDADLVAATIAQAFGVREGEGRTLVEALQSFLREKRLLLVLDNFEQVVEAASFLGDLLGGAPDLTLLVTSRVVLRISGEQEYPVLPLPLPGAKIFPAAVAQVPSVALFVERAAQARPAFALSDANATAVADICSRLDGLPLAIELAAARIRLLSPDAIRARLHERLKLLTAGPRDLPERQKSLHGAIQWSYDLLSHAERTLFRRLSVFAGGWTQEAAEAVCAEDDRSTPAVLDGLASLVDASLVVQQAAADGEPRFTMLETIREYALEQLAASDEGDTIRRRHAGYWLSTAESAERELEGADQLVWTRRLRTEHENVRSALAWCRQSRDAATGLQLATALNRFWLRFGHVSEARRWLDAMMDIGPDVPKPLLARALRARGWLVGWLGDPTRAAELIQEGLELSRAAQDRRGVAEALAELGGLARLEGDGPTATRLLEESLALLREVGDPNRIAWAVANLGDVARFAREMVRATELYEEACRLYRASGNVDGVARMVVRLGLVAQFHPHPDYERALTLYEQALLMQSQAGCDAGRAETLLLKGVLLNQRGESSQATTCLAESLTLFLALEDFAMVAGCIEGLVGATAGQGLHEQAVWMLGGAEALRERLGRPMPPPFRRLHAQVIDRLRTAMGETAFAGARAQGRTLPVDRFVALALEQIGSPTALP